MKRIVVLTAILAILVCLATCGKDRPLDVTSPSLSTRKALTIPDNPLSSSGLPPATVQLEPAVPFAMLTEITTEEATLNPSEISTILKPGECIGEHKVLHLPTEVVPPKGDIIFAIDLTGSMGGEHNNVKNNSINIMNAIRGVIPDTDFGVISHMDYDGWFTGCGYSGHYGSAASGDYPYQLNQALTSNTDAVASAINGLSLGSGADGPENYSRVLWESWQSDAGIGWRFGAKRILLFWQDALPHDCNVDLDCGIYPGTSSGPDPGRDATVGTSDDLDLAATLQGMVDNNITLIALHSGGSLSLWDCYAGKTGGDALQINSNGTVPGGTDIADFVAALITEEIKHIDELTLEVCDEDYEDWLISVDPSYYTDIDLDEAKDFEFDIQICVPIDTEAGEYCFDICAVGDGVEYARQHVCITVITCVEGAEVRVTPETFNVQQTGQWVTGHVTLPPGYTNADITGGEIISIGGISTSIAGEKKGNGILKFSAAEFAEVAGDIVAPWDPRVEDVEVCVVVYFSDGMESCEYCDRIDIINRGLKG